MMQVCSAFTQNNYYIGYNVVARRLVSIIKRNAWRLLTKTLHIYAFNKTLTWRVEKYFHSARWMEARSRR